jgi:hypothetical protein
MSGEGCQLVLIFSRVHITVAMHHVAGRSGPDGAKKFLSDEQTFRTRLG